MPLRASTRLRSDAGSRPVRSSHPVTVPESGAIIAMRWDFDDDVVPVPGDERVAYLAADCKPYLAEVQKHLADAGLAGEFRYHGVLDRADKISFLRKLDVMSVPATYDEPKGVSLLEAAVWLGAVLLLNRLDWTLPGLIALNALVYAGCIVATRRFQTL